MKRFVPVALSCAIVLTGVGQASASVDAAAGASPHTSRVSTATEESVRSRLMASTVVTPESFGAKGDGVADDTRAVQRALDAVPVGGTVQFGTGKVYRHSAVLIERVAGARLIGSAVLLATDEARSSFWVAAPDVLVEGLTFRMKSTTRRWSAYEQMKLRLAGVTGTVVRNVRIEGAAAAGIYVGRSSNFLLENVSVSNTRADGIQMTNGSHDGKVIRPLVTNSGDDGVAVVSYQEDPAVCHHILVDSPVVRGTAWGRGLSVVGGEDITERNVNVDSSSAAAIYVANEGSPYYTYGVKRVTFTGGRLTHANTDSAIDHGAILLYSRQPGYALVDVSISDIAISGTRASAPWQVGVRSGGGQVENARLNRLSTPSRPTPFLSNMHTSRYLLRGWVRTAS